jgi:CheY-like chemotaxis protein
MKVLVVEDSPSSLDLVTEVLEAGGFEVTTAPDAQQGIEQARRSAPDIVLMDISLPGLDGLSAARLLRDDRSTSHLPILIMTAHAGSADEANARATGCDGFITKPFDTRTLADTVRRTLARR